MKWNLQALLGVIFFTALAACGGMKYTSARPDLIEKGRSYAVSRCAHCHGIGRMDESPLEQAPPFRRLRERYPIEQLAEAFAERIVVGHSEMPGFTLDPGEIEALLAYLESLRGGSK